MHNEEGRWIVPFKGRNHSGATEQNFLWQFGNVYVMDNHRAALWCWLQQSAASRKLNLLHIDEHYDTLYSRIDDWLEALPPLDGISIDDYLSLSYGSEVEDVPVIRWDNYLSLYLERYTNQIECAVFATHGVGDIPRLKKAMFVEPQDLANNINFWINSSQQDWIINVDLDYFFCDQPDGRRLMFSDAYIESVFNAIGTAVKTSKVACLTLCLTPDESYTGGWQQAESLCAIACKFLEVPFSLPGSK